MSFTIVGVVIVTGADTAHYYLILSCFLVFGFRA